MQRLRHGRKFSTAVSSSLERSIEHETAVPHPSEQHKYDVFREVAILAARLVPGQSLGYFHGR